MAEETLKFEIEMNHGFLQVLALVVLEEPM